MRRFIYSFLLVSIAGVSIAGCSKHENPPATPATNAATPTNRSFVNSTDQPNTPFYTQPGVNHGQPVALKPIPSQAGFNQNTPLATTVHEALAADNTLDSRYIAVQTKGDRVLLVGSVTNPADKAKAEAIAKKQAGVGGVIDKLQVAGASKSGT